MISVSRTAFRIVARCVLALIVFAVIPSEGEARSRSGKKQVSSKQLEQPYSRKASASKLHNLQMQWRGREYQQLLVELFPEMSAKDREQAQRLLISAARSPGPLVPLSGGRSWLKIKGVGRAADDQTLLRVADVAASRVFDVPWSLGDVVVLGSGISMRAERRIRAVQGDIGADSLEMLHEVLLSYGGDIYSMPRRDATGVRLELARRTYEATLSGKSSPMHGLEMGGWFSSYSKALRPFTGKLLVVVAHHVSRDRTGYVIVGRGNRRVEVPIDMMMAYAADAGVQLFVLGCKSADSTPLGVNQVLTADQAARAIDRVFDSPVKTYGEVFERITADGLEVLFDPAYARDGKVFVRRSAIFESWVELQIPRMYRSGDEYCAFTARKVRGWLPDGCPTGPVPFRTDQSRPR